MRDVLLSDATKELTRLLEHWRANRHESTSELIHLVGGLVRFDPSPLPKRGQKAVALEWLDVTAREGPATLSHRLAQLEPLISDWSPSNLWPVFEAISTRAADPRLGTFATRLLVGDLRIEFTDKLRRRLLNCVEVHGDIGHYRALEVGLSTKFYDGGLTERVLRLMKKGLASQPTGPELPPSERASLASQLWEPGELPSSANDLFALVYEDPHDLTRRQVLADSLLERADPRGEFIALQLAKRDEKRQAALIKKYGKQWLGPFAKVVDDFTFEDGFVSRIQLKHVTVAQFQVLAAAKEWATVKHVRHGVQRFSKTMISLEDPGAISAEALRGYLRDKLSLPIAQLVLDEVNEETLPQLQSFRRLKSLYVRIASLRHTEFFVGANWPALESLTLLTTNFNHGVTAWLGLRGVMKPANLTMMMEHSGDALEIRQKDGGFVLHLRHVANLLDPERLLPTVARVINLKPTRIRAQFVRPPRAVEEAVLRSLATPLGIPIDWIRGGARND
ncbi:MAG: hypothetical protein ACO1OB_27195 [Archangium sp.]